MLKTVLAVALLWTVSASAAEQVPCWKAKALLVYTGGDKREAEKIAVRHGYSKAQIAEARQRCGL